MKVITCAKGGDGWCRLTGILSVVGSKDMAGGEYEVTKLSTLPEAAQNGEEPSPEGDQNGKEKLLLSQEGEGQSTDGATARIDIESQNVAEADQNGKEPLLLSQEGEGQSTDNARIDIESLPVPSIEAGWPWWKIGAGCIVGAGVCLGVWCGWNLIVSHEPDSHEPDSHEPEDRHEQPPINASLLASMKVSMDVCKNFFKELENRTKIGDPWMLNRPTECRVNGGTLVCVEDDGSPSCHFFGNPWELSFFSVFESVGRSLRCRVRCNTPAESKVMLAQRVVALLDKNETAEDVSNRIYETSECFLKETNCEAIPMVYYKTYCDCPIVFVDATVLNPSIGGWYWPKIAKTVHIDLDRKSFKPVIAAGHVVKKCSIRCYGVRV